ncbi:MAG: pantetheine-phosphate adenylyltransferase [Planctomycetota bacterium]
MVKSSRKPGRALYPGTFDPVTFGHLDVIARGSRLVGELVVAVLHNAGKSPLFPVSERVAMLRRHARRLPNVRVGHFDGLTVDYARRCGAAMILRGIRTVSDFENEFQMALTNRAMAPDLETIFVMSSGKYAFLNSHLIKEIIRAGGDVRAFVPADVAAALRRKMKKPSRR